MPVEIHNTSLLEKAYLSRFKIVWLDKKYEVNMSNFCIEREAMEAMKQL